jgi:acetolactate synthase-1/3 small subunit
MKLIAPFGILGLMALPRSPLYGPDEQEKLKEADDIVDASTLPPG